MQIIGFTIEDLELNRIGSWPKIIRMALVVAVGIGVFLLNYFIYLNEMTNYHNQLKQKRSTMQNIFESAYDKASNVHEYKKQVLAIEQSLVELTRQIPKDNEEAGLLDDLSHQAIASGLILQAFKPFSEEHKDFYVEHPIELSMQGNYHSFGQFISNIVSMPRIVTLHDFSIKVAAKNPKNLQITLNVKTYRILEKEADL